MDITPTITVINNKPVEHKLNDPGLPKEKFSEKDREFRALIAQVVAVVGFGVLLFGIGLIFSMPTIVIGGLLNNKNELFYLDEYGASWFGSIIYMSQPLGSIVSGFLQDTFGRKRCMMMVNIPQVVGWILVYYSTSVEFLYASAAILGLSIGFMEAPVLSYVGEITQPRLRGILSSFSGSFAGVGILMECFIGALTDWRSTCAISAMIPVFAFIALSLIPESPTWLILQGRITEAEQALCWLRGWVHPMYIREEFLALLEYTKSTSSNIKEMTTISAPEENKISNDTEKDHESPKKTGIMATILLIKQPKLYRPLRMVLVTFFISHCISLLAIRPFLVNIFSLIGMPLSPHWVLVVSGTLQITGSLIGMFVMRILGKRKVNYISLSVCIVSCYALAVSVMLNDVIPWIPFSLFCILFFAAGFGIIPLPWILVSEVFPIDGRGMAGGLAAAVSYLLMFLVTKTYINLSKWFDLYGSLFIYGTVGLVGLVYMHFYLPETEGKTLAEIETYFESKKEVKTPQLSPKRPSVEA